MTEAVLEKQATTPPTPDPAATTPATPPVPAAAAPAAQAATQAPITPAPAAKTVVPEKYDLKLPTEGNQLKASDLERISAQAKEKGLSNEDAQKLVLQENETINRHLSAQLKDVKEVQSKNWLAELKADAEIGGDKLNESIENAKRVFVKYFPEDFRKVIDESGLGNVPGFVKGMAKIAKAFGEDHFKDGGRPVQSSEPKDPAAIMYDKTSKG